MIPHRPPRSTASTGEEVRSSGLVEGKAGVGSGLRASRVNGPTPADHDQRFEFAMREALQLVGIVHGDGDQADVAQLLSQSDLPALCVALAALVPDDRSPSELLAWHEGIHQVCVGGKTWTEVELKRLHAAYTRGERNGQVLAGESAHSQWRRRERKARRGVA